MTDPDLLEPAPARLPSQLWQPWTLIVPALLILPMLCLAFAWQGAPGGNQAIEQSTKPVPLATARPLAKRPESVRYFVPTADGKLHAKSWGVIGAASDDSFESYGRAALNALFADSRDYFPPGTQIEGLTLIENDGQPLARLSLNETFWNSDYWAMDSRPHMVIEAIAHTLNDVYQQSGGSGTLSVQLLRDGHEMSVLGQDDVADPFTPDATMVATP